MFFLFHSLLLFFFFFFFSSRRRHTRSLCDWSSDVCSSDLPLQSDFEAVAQAAQAGNGGCAGTEAALLKTEQDFAALPSTVDSGLRSRLRQGILNLRKQSLELCKQPLPQTTTAPLKTTATQT